MSVERIRVGVVGAGAVARAVHLPLLTKRRDLFEVVGLCDLSTAVRDGAGDRFGLGEGARFGNVGELVDKTAPDALVVLTSGSHAPVVAESLSSGLAVLSEKPLAYTRGELEELARVLGGRPDRLMVGYMKQYDPAVELAASLTPDRPRPRSVEVTVLHPSTSAQLAVSEMGPSIAPDLSPTVASSLGARIRDLEVEALGEAAGPLGRLYTEVLLGSLVHDLAVMRSLGLRLEEVDHAERWPEGAFPPSVAVMGRSADGVRVSMRWHYLEDYPSYREEVRWHDPEGSVELVFPSPYLLHAPTRLTVTSAVATGAEERRFGSPAEAFEEELVAFHAMVTEGRLPRSGLAEATEDVVTCQRIAARLARSEGLDPGGEAQAFDPGALVP